MMVVNDGENQVFIWLIIINEVIHQSPDIEIEYFLEKYAWTYVCTVENLLCPWQVTAKRLNCI